MPGRPPDDWGREFLDTIIAAKLVDGVDGAIAHIRRYGSHHTDCILTEDDAAAERFFQRLDSAILMRNASTQFADGGEFGMGAEIGIATGKLHARGPVGAEQLTSFKYLVEGDGTIAPEPAETARRGAPRRGPAGLSHEAAGSVLTGPIHVSGAPRRPSFPALPDIAEISPIRVHVSPPSTHDAFRLPGAVGIAGHLQHQLAANGGREAAPSLHGQYEGAEAADHAFGKVEIQIRALRIRGRVPVISGRPFMISPAATAMSRATVTGSPSLLGPFPEMSMTLRSPSNRLRSSSRCPVRIAPEIDVWRRWSGTSWSSFIDSSKPSCRCLAARCAEPCCR